MNGVPGGSQDRARAKWGSLRSKVFERNPSRHLFYLCIPKSRATLALQSSILYNLLTRPKRPFNLLVFPCWSISRGAKRLTFYFQVRTGQVSLNSNYFGRAIGEPPHDGSWRRRDILEFRVGLVLVKIFGIWTSGREQKHIFISNIYIYIYILFVGFQRKGLHVFNCSSAPSPTCSLTGSWTISLGLPTGDPIRGHFM